MREIDDRLLHWRRSVAAHFQRRPDALDELEGHLFDVISELVDAGMDLDTAFASAQTRLGTPSEIAAEFSKNGVWYAPWWPIRLVWLVGILLLSVCGQYLVPYLQQGGVKALLAVHMTAVTLGYLATVAIGLLGVCYFFSRQFGNLNTGQCHSINRHTLLLSGLALMLTGVGMILGCFCPLPKVGPFWGYSAHEVGGVAILLWDMVMVLMAYRTFRHARLVPKVMAAGFLGNVIVLCGWLAAMTLERHAHSFSLSAVVLLFSMQLILASTILAPAGTLRRMVTRLN